MRVASKTTRSVGLRSPNRSRAPLCASLFRTATARPIGSGVSPAVSPCRPCGLGGFWGRGHAPTVTSSYTYRHDPRRGAGHAAPSARFSAMSEPSTSATPHVPLPTGGTVRPITRWGEPVMHRAQEPITAYDDELRALVADMVATMYAADGVGPRRLPDRRRPVGVRLRLPRRRGRAAPRASCATRSCSCPRARTASLDDDDEGCLSLPGAFVACARRRTRRSRGRAWTASR